MLTSKLVEKQGVSSNQVSEKVAQAFGDLDSIMILHAVSKIPQTAQDVAGKTGVPLSSVYRKLASLRKAGLVYLKSSEIAQGRKRDLFASAVSEIRVVIDSEGIVLDLIPTEEYAERAQFVVFTRANRFSGNWCATVKATASSD